MRLGAAVSKRQYVDHLAPVWSALEQHERGPVRMLAGVEEYSAAHGLVAGGEEADLWLSCAIRDTRLTDRSLKSAYMEHGTGLQWYPRGVLLGLRRMGLFATPNEFIAARYRSEFPQHRVEVIGTPKLDELLRIPAESNGRTIAISFHWTSVRRAPIPPTRRFESAVLELAAREDLTVIGHGHPHVWGDLEPWYRERGIEPVAQFNDVVRRADIYVCDHSSTIYEWAALGRPVVLMDHPGQERLPRVPSGLRYATHADVGIHATEGTLVRAVDAVLAQDEYCERRAVITSELYPYLGHAAARAVDVLRSVASEPTPRRRSPVG